MEEIEFKRKCFGILPDFCSTFYRILLYQYVFDDKLYLYRFIIEFCE